MWLNEAIRRLQRTTYEAGNGDKCVRHSVQPRVVGRGDDLTPFDGVPLALRSHRR